MSKPADKKAPIEKPAKETFKERIVNEAGESDDGAGLDTAASRFLKKAATAALAGVVVAKNAPMPDSGELTFVKGTAAVGFAAEQEYRKKKLLEAKQQKLDKKFDESEEVDDDDYRLEVAKLSIVDKADAKMGALGSSLLPAGSGLMGVSNMKKEVTVARPPAAPAAAAKKSGETTIHFVSGKAAGDKTHQDPGKSH
jgi:hypothetical protein